MGKRALVLSGGGSLGAYQIGVWQALRELHISYDIVTGTSIGALNGAFFTTGKYDLARDLWNHITVSKVIAHGINLDAESIREAFQKRRPALAQFARSYFAHGGADITPFIKLVDQYVDADEVHCSPIRFGITATALPTFALKCVVMQDTPAEDIKDWLHASSAIVPVFPVHKVRRKPYIDGGYREHMPIRFAFKLGATEAIVVNLFYKIDVHPNLTSKPNVTFITPSWPLGSQMSFKRKVITRNMALGYNDAMKAFHRRRGFRYTFEVTDPTPEPAELFVALLKCDFPHAWKAIDRLLEQHTGGLSTPQNRYLRAVEILAETLGVDPQPTYQVNALAEQCYRLLKPAFNGREIIGLLRKLRQHKPFSKADESKALCAIKDVVIRQSHPGEIAHIERLSPKMALLYTLIGLTHSRLGDEIICADDVCLRPQKTPPRDEKED